MRRPELLSRRGSGEDGPPSDVAAEEGQQVGHTLEVAAVPVAVAPAADGGEAVAKARQPVYPRLLRLRHVHPNAWQRALLGEGMALTGGVLALADLASAWTVLVLPVAVGVVVKGHDVLAGALEPEPDLGRSGPDSREDAGGR